MKLHLPKVLLTAVVAVLGVQYSGAAVTTEVKSGESAIVIGTGENAKTYEATLVTGNSNTGIKLTGDGAISLAEGTILGFGMTSSTTGTTAPGSGNGNYFYTNYTYSGDILVYDSDTTDSADMGLVINNGNTNQVVVFGGKVSGNGVISIVSLAPTSGITLKFTGNMSDYTGTMKGDSANKFAFEGATSGAGILTTTNSVTVANSTMNNSSITAASLSVTGISSFAGVVDATSLSISGTSSFAGNVIATTLTLGADAAVTFGAGTVVTVGTGIAGTSGSLTLGEGATMVFTDVVVSSSSALVHDSYGYKTDRTVDLLGGTLTANREVSVTVNGTAATMAADGSVASLSDNKYYISGNVNASTLNASDDDVSAADSIWMTGGTLTMDEDYTVSGSAMITGTTISKGEGKLIVADGATVQVDVANDSKKLKGKVQIDAGGTLEFLGTGCDATDYSSSGRSTISIAGTMDVGTTRQTVGGWTFELTGGTIQGAGQASVDSVGLDFHSDAASTIYAKAATGATAANPTVSTISTKMRVNQQTLTINVEENARLDMTGILTNNGGTYTLEKSGVGTLRLQNNDNVYKNVTVTGGTLEVRDNGVTMDTVSVDNGSTLALMQTNNSSSTLAALTLNGGSYLTQGTGGAYTTTLTSLTVGENGGTIGTMHDLYFNSTAGTAVSYEANIVVSSLSGTGDLIVTSESNTSNATTIRINGGTGYSGTVKVQNNTGAGGRKTNLLLASDTALAGSVVELGGGNVAATTETNLELGAATTAVKGIKDAEGSTNTANVQHATNTSTSELTINTGSESFSTRAGVKQNINLVKQGTGTQEFGGDMSSFGSAEGDTDGNIEIQGGKLSFTKNGGSMAVNTLTLSGGTLEVTGSLTLTNVAVSNLASYFNADTLSATLATAGTLAFDNVDTWTGSTYEIDGKSYTTSLSVVDNSLKLNFTPDSLDTLDVYVTMQDTGYDEGTLTLAMVDANGNLINTAADNYNVIGLYGDAEWDAIRELITDGANPVAITLQGAEGFTIVGNGDLNPDPEVGAGNVSFYGKYYGEYNANSVAAGSYNPNYIPEPASATLGLAALMMLATRRRRKA